MQICNLYLITSAARENLCCKSKHLREIGSQEKTASLLKILSKIFYFCDLYGNSSAFLDLKSQVLLAVFSGLSVRWKVNLTW